MCKLQNNADKIILLNGDLNPELKEACQQAVYYSLWPYCSQGIHTPEFIDVAKICFLSEKTFDKLQTEFFIFFSKQSI